VSEKPDVSENRQDTDWSGPDIDSLLGGAAWSGTAEKDRELSNVHADAGSHVSSFSARNDGMDADVAMFALMAAPDREKNDDDDSDDVTIIAAAEAGGGWWRSKAAADGT
jgi:hypothetical protein